MDARGDVPADQGTFSGQVVADEFSDAETSFGGAMAVRSHAVGGGTNRLMLVGVSVAATTTQVASVSYGTTGLTRVGAVDAQQGRVELWQLVAPPSGTANVTVMLTNTASTSVIGIGSFSGVSQATPLGTFTSATGTTGPPAVNVASWTGQIVESVVMWRGNGENLTSNHTLQWRREVASEIAAGATAPGAPNVPMTYTVSNNANAPWAIAAVTIHPGG